MSRKFGTGARDRTPINGFGDHCSTIELHRQLTALVPTNRIELFSPRPQRSALTTKLSRITNMPRSKEYHRKNQALRYSAKRQKIIAYLGGECVICGTSNNLHFHHKIPEEKSFAISKNYEKKWIDILPEINKCELLCAKHHSDAHAPEHGTISRYCHRKCRCVQCRAAWNQYMKAYKKEWRKRQKLVPKAGIDPATFRI